MQNSTAEAAGVSCVIAKNSALMLFVGGVNFREFFSGVENLK